MLSVSDNLYYVKLDYVGILIYEVRGGEWTRSRFRLRLSFIGMA